MTDREIGTGEAFPMADIFATSRLTGTQRAIGNDRGSAIRLVTDCLALAATPTFAVAALLAALGGGEPDFLCAALQHASPLGGMVPMYVLMSAFHSPPWLKLMSSRRNPRGRSYAWRRHGAAVHGTTV
jgi:hypothetical protein